MTTNSAKMTTTPRHVHYHLADNNDNENDEEGHGWDQESGR
jgi:hypothetical protein